VSAIKVLRIEESIGPVGNKWTGRVGGGGEGVEEIIQGAERGRDVSFES